MFLKFVCSFRLGCRSSLFNGNWIIGSMSLQYARMPLAVFSHPDSVPNDVLNYFQPRQTA